MNNKSYFNLMKSWSVVFFVLLGLSQNSAIAQSSDYDDDQPEVSNGQQRDKHPKIKCPDDITIYIDCDERCGKLKCGQDGSDDVESHRGLRCEYDEDRCFRVGRNEVWCFVKHRDGRETKCSYEVTVRRKRDKEPPKIKCPDDITVFVDCPQKCAIVKCGGAEAWDNCDSYPEVWCEFDDNHCYELGTTEAWCFAKDRAGNKSKCSYAVTVKTVDATPPTITCPADISLTVACNETCATTTLPTVTARDICDPNPKVTCNFASNFCFPIGTTVVTCTATDNFGNTARCTYRVVVTVRPDVTPPTITCPANITATVPCDQPCVRVNFTTPTATDNCDANPRVTCDVVSGDCFTRGVKVVTCTARDAAGNTSQCTFTITVRDFDVTPPVIKCRSNIDLYVDCGLKCSRIMWWMDPEVSDNCDPNPSVNCAQDRYFCFPLGVTQATCTAVDRSGNRSTCTYTVTVREKDDFIPPVITCPADIMKSTTSMRCEPVAFSASATDNCGPATVTCTPASGFCFPIGKTLVTCTATDKSNNKSTCTFNVMVMMMGDLVGTGNNGAVASDKRILNDKTTGESNTNRDFNLPASQKLHYEFQAFPNPVGNFVNLELKQYQGKQVVVQMFNTLGQQVYNANLKEVSSELYKVDTQNLSSGTYYIKVVAEGIETTAKMVTKN